MKLKGSGKMKHRIWRICYGSDYRVDVSASTVRGAIFKAIQKQKKEKAWHYAMEHITSVELIASED